MYTTDMSPEGWDQILKILRGRIYNPPNINLPRLLDHSLYDVIANAPWTTKANHLLFLLTPNQTVNFNYDNKEPLADLINQQIKKKQLSAFIYNFNPSLSKYLKAYNTVDSENIFDTDHDPDDIIQRILQENRTQQLNQLLRPRFDSLDLKYNGQDILFNSPARRLKRSINTDNVAKPSYRWIANQSGETREYITQDPNLRLHIDSLLPNLIQTYDHKKVLQQTNLVFLPKKIHEPQTSKNLDSTIFPYRLVIIDDYIAGFTDQKRLIFKNVDPTAPHTIREIKFSSLGRIVNQKITSVPIQNKIESLSQKPSNTTQSIAQQNTSTTQMTYAKNTDTSPSLVSLINKLPNCGVKNRSPLPQIQYFNAYFF